VTRRDPDRRTARLTPRQRGVLIAAAAANSLVLFDQTVVSVALPAIQRDFDSSTAEVQWTMGAYLLTLASLMAAAGRLADLYGRRRLFLLGVAIIGVGSIACAAAPDELSLILARALQGAGAALAQPLALATATAAMSRERQGWAVGLLGAVGTTCLALGPLVGGLLAETVGWRWIFILNVPIVTVALVFALLQMEETRRADAQPLDWLGLVVLTGGLGALVTGLLHLREWTSPLDLAVLGAAALLLGAFVLVERRPQHPLIPLQLFTVPAVSASLLALFVVQLVVLGVTVYVVLYLQNGLGLSAIEAGLVLVPAMLWSPLLSTRTGRMTDRLGSRRLVGLGLVATASGLVLIALGGLAEEALLLVPGLLVFGISRPFVFTPAGTGAVKALPDAERGLAASLATESRQVGAVLGVAALGSIAAAFEGGGGSGADAEGLAAAMLAGAVLSAAAALVALRLLPRRTAERTSSPAR
jgi:EmrB/QacA subfamily drug resistance transporter